MAYELKKPYTTKERLEFLIKYNDEMHLRTAETAWALYALLENEIMVNDKPVIDPDWDSKFLEKRRAERLEENERKRDEFLLANVVYKEVEYDSDTDQKINILSTVATMSDMDTIDWVGADGVSKLTCTKEDLTNIGNLISVKTTYVWQRRNPELKTAITNAQTLEELEAIEIYYDMNEALNS